MEPYASWKERLEPRRGDGTASCSLEPYNEEASVSKSGKLKVFDMSASCGRGLTRITVVEARKVRRWKRGGRCIVLQKCGKSPLDMDPLTDAQSQKRGGAGR